MRILLSVDIGCPTITESLAIAEKLCKIENIQGQLLNNVNISQWKVEQQISTYQIFNANNAMIEEIDAPSQEAALSIYILNHRLLPNDIERLKLKAETKAK